MPTKQFTTILVFVAVCTYCCTYCCTTVVLVAYLDLTMCPNTFRSASMDMKYSDYTHDDDWAASIGVNLYYTGETCYST